MTYNDAFLKPRITPERVAQATAEVDAIATFPAAWRERLIVLRTYVIACTELQTGEPNDTFAVKLTAYRREYDATLSQARAQVVSGSPVAPSWPSLGANPGRY